MYLLSFIYYKTAGVSQGPMTTTSAVAGGPGTSSNQPVSIRVTSEDDHVVELDFSRLELSTSDQQQARDISEIFMLV